MSEHIRPLAAETAEVPCVRASQEGSAVGLNSYRLTTVVVCKVWLGVEEGWCGTLAAPKTTC
jgi:hypothetical protein